MKRFLQSLYSAAVEQNYKNIYELAEFDNAASFLDLGCDDGAVTLQVARRIGTTNIAGVEIVPSRAEEAERRGVKVHAFDLNSRFELQSDLFDVVHANQVIEHLHNSDTFLAEVYRVLKPGGYAIVSTENGSSWCNVFAALMGWQMFSLTNFSSMKRGIGNPLAIHRADEVDEASWNHVRIYNIRGLKEYFESFGFAVEEIKGAGYFSLPGYLATVDKTHCHFMTFKVRKLPASCSSLMAG
jgi:SAM-dependent methyltransferase